MGAAKPPSPARARTAYVVRSGDRATLHYDSKPVPWLLVVNTPRMYGTAVLGQRLAEIWRESA